MFVLGVQKCPIFKPVPAEESGPYLRHGPQLPGAFQAEQVTGRWRPPQFPTTLDLSIVQGLC